MARARTALPGKKHYGSHIYNFNSSVGHIKKKRERELNFNNICNLTRYVHDSIISVRAQYEQLIDEILHMLFWF